MILHVRPVGQLKGRIRLPASKSYSIRAAIIAACGGHSRIRHMSDCDDAKVAVRIARALGASVAEQKDVLSIQASGRMAVSKTFEVGESGTTLRFLLPLLPLHVRRAIVKGKGTLVGRPNAHLCRTLREVGLDIGGIGDKESVPITFKGGAITPGRIVIDGSLSSQFISALLTAVPRLEQDCRIVIIGKEMVSQDYIVMTTQILARAGIAIKKMSAREYMVKGRQTFKGLKNFNVPSDYGLAAFAMAAAALLPSDVVLQGHWDDTLVQSDGHILPFMKRLGARFQKTSQAIRMAGPCPLKGGVFSLQNCPDLVPIMSVLALFAKGKTELVHIHHARAKESDRISDLRQELLKIGAKIRESKDALIIEPQSIYKNNVLLDAHNDHRLAMAFTVLGLKIGTRVQGIESSHKSYPGFVQDMQKLGAGF